MFLQEAKELGGMQIEPRMWRFSWRADSHLTHLRMASEFLGKGFVAALVLQLQEMRVHSASPLTHRNGTSGSGSYDPMDMKTPREVGKGGPQMQVDQAVTAASTLDELILADLRVHGSLVTQSQPFTKKMTFVGLRSR